MNVRRLRHAVPLALLVAAAGCTPAGTEPEQPPPNRSVFVAYPAMDAEFQAEKGRLTLPPGVGWPSHAPKMSADGTYGVGFGTSRAGEFWYCSWAAEWLTQRDRSPSRTARAWSQLVRVTETELYRVGYAPETRKLTDDVLARARAGDPGGLAQDVAQNC